MGVKVALSKLAIPNVAPNTAPYFGPMMSDPRITGICRVVAFTIGSGISPSGVNANIKTIAISMLVKARYFDLLQVFILKTHLSIILSV